MTEDNVVPGDKWAFDADVAKCFDSMLARSIPQYEEMRRLCHAIGNHFVTPASTVVDLGASRGEALRPFIEQGVANDFIAIEISEPMRAVMFELYGDKSNVGISDLDLRNLNAKDFDVNQVSLVLSILTIQFTPIEYRLHILQEIYDMLEPGGAFLFVEKVMGASSTLDKIMTEEYYGMKTRNGYSYDDIKRKRASLEGVLVPMTATWNEDLLKSVGFRQVDCFYRNLNFAGWVAIK